MQSDTETLERSLAGVEALVGTVLRELGDLDRKDGEISISYRNRTLQGPLAEITDLLAYCLYIVMHAKQREDLGDTDTENSTGPDHNADLVIDGLNTVFGARMFPVPVSILAEHGDAVLIEHRGLLVNCPVDRLVDRADPRMMIEHYSAAVSPGYYYIYGAGDIGHSAPLQHRTYVSLTTADDVVDLAGHIIAELDDSGVSYNAKFLSDPGSYPRSDAVTIYHDAPDIVNERIAAVVRTLSAATGPISDYCVPVGPGVALATDPIGPMATGRSFGQHRSRMLAELALDVLTGRSTIEDGVHRVAAKYSVDPYDAARNKI